MQLVVSLLDNKLFVVNIEVSEYAENVRQPDESDTPHFCRIVWLHSISILLYSLKETVHLREIYFFISFKYDFGLNCSECKINM